MFSFVGLSKQFSCNAAIVEYHQGQEFDASYMMAAAGSFASSLMRHPGKRWGLFIPDTLPFGISLLGLLLADKDVVLLPSPQPGIIEKLSIDVDGFVLPERPTYAPAWIPPADLGAKASGGTFDQLIDGDQHLNLDLFKALVPEYQSQLTQRTDIP